MNQHQVGIPLLQSLAGGFAAVRGAIVHNPENPLGLPVRFLTDDLLDQAVEWSDAGSRVTAAEDLGPPDIPGCQIGQGATAFIFKLNTQGLAGLGGLGGVDADSRLNAGFLIG